MTQTGKANLRTLGFSGCLFLAVLLGPVSGMGVTDSYLSQVRAAAKEVRELSRTESSQIDSERLSELAKTLETLQSSPDFDLLPADGEGFPILEFGDTILEAWTHHFGEPGRDELTGRLLLMMAIGTGQFQTDFVGALVIYPYLLNERYRDEDQFHRAIRLIAKHSGLSTENFPTEDRELTVRHLGVIGYHGLGIFPFALEWARESAHYVDEEGIKEPGALAFTFLSLAELEWTHGHANAAREAFARIPVSALEEDDSFDLATRYEALRALIEGEQETDSPKASVVLNPSPTLRKQYLSELVPREDSARTRGAVLVREHKEGRLAPDEAAELWDKLNNYAEETGRTVPTNHRGRPLSDVLRLELAALDLERPFSADNDLDFLFESDYTQMQQLAQRWFDELYGSFYAQFGMDLEFFEQVHDLWQAMDVLEYSMAAQVTRENMIRLGTSYSTNAEVSLQFLVNLAPIFADTLSRSAAYQVEKGDVAEAASALRRLNEVASQRYSRQWNRGGNDLGDSISRLHPPLASALESWTQINEAASGSTRTTIASDAFFTAQLAQLGDVAMAIQAGLRRSAANSPEVSTLLESYERVQRDSEHYSSIHEGAENVSKNLEALRDVAHRIENLRAESSEELRDVLPFLEQYSSISPVSKEQLQAALDLEEAFVLIIPGESATALFLVHADGILFERSSLTGRELTGKIAGFRFGLDPTLINWEAPSPFDLNMAYELYAELLKPLEEGLDGKSHFVYIAEGAVSGLPLHVLLTEPPSPGLLLSDAPWLALRHATTVSPSVAAFVAGRSLPDIPRERERLGLVGFADPDFGGQAEEAVTRSSENLDFQNFFRGVEVDLDQVSRKLKQLPRTRTEVETVSKLLGGESNRIFAGREATETQVWELEEENELARYRIVYFATHGLVAGDFDGITEPGLVLTLPDEVGEKDDGLLAASEISRLRLNADWVVLSACNTASGNEPGAPALSGVTRSFFQAGARSVLASHWPVISDAAVELVTSTFEGAVSNEDLTRAEALRRAMMEIVTHPDAGRKTEPAYWAPFIIVGTSAQE